MQQQFISL